MNDDERHCIDVLRAGDQDFFIAGLFAPDGKRRSLMALHAFAVELARIPRSVSEPQLGLIRQQWWLDTLDGIYRGETQSHPVARELALAIGAAGMPKAALGGMVAAREADLYRRRFDDIAALEDYLGRTFSTAIQLSCLVLAGEGASRCVEASGYGGVALGLARLLTDLQFAQRLPAGMTLEDARLHAERRLEQARAAGRRAPRKALPGLLPIALTGLYLKFTGKNAFPSYFRRQLRLWWSVYRNIF